MKLLLRQKSLKIIWVSNHTFSAARQQVLYYNHSAFEPRFIGRVLSIQLSLSVPPSVRNILQNPLISFIRYWGGVEFHRCSKVAQLRFLEQFILWKKKSEKVLKMASKLSFRIEQKIKLLGSSGNSLKWKY